MKPISASMDTIAEALITLDDITAWAPAGSCSSLNMLRLDKVHPVVSGNKWYKLRYNIAAAKAAGCNALLSFGGGYSNHLVATAAAAPGAGLGSIGFVRGIYEKDTPTLAQCRSFGMRLRFLTKADYAAARHNPEPFKEAFPAAFIIPEGGANEAGIRGAAAIAQLIPPDATDVCVAVGTGATLAGLNDGLPEGVRLHGFCAARECDNAARLIRSSPTWGRIQIHAAQDARFGKWTDGLLRFMQQVFRETGVPLDVVYTGKMMQAVQELLRNGYFSSRDIVCIHTGGLQGNPEALFRV